MKNINQIILDNIPVSMITIDKKGYITSANKYFKNFSRIKDYHGHNIFTDEFFIKKNLKNNFKKLLKDGGLFRKDNCHEINIKGEDKYLRIIAVPFTNEKGKIEGIVSLASDNTEAILLRNKLIELNNNLEEKIEEKTSDLKKANEDLNKNIELKSTFISDVSHEFRTSLTIMQCSLELLCKSGDIKKENSELYNNVIKEIKRVSSMLSSLSSIARNNPLDSKGHFKKINLNSLIPSILKGLEPVAVEKQIKIKYKNTKYPIEIGGNKEDIEKLILNLVRNAIKYNKDNGWIQVSVEKLKKGINLKVKDSGIGISKKEISNIFERFYRVDKSRTRNQHDSGLGLAICKHVVETHNGNIKVFSTLGKGSLFKVYLPFNL
jgi:signal transduction histidine kinase